VCSEPPIPLRQSHLELYNFRNSREVLNAQVWTIEPSRRKRLIVADMVDPGSCAEVSKNYIDFQKSTATYVQSQLKRQLFQNATKSQKLNQSPSGWCCYKAVNITNPQHAKLSLYSTIPSLQRARGTPGRWGRLTTRA
jgi:hypothetical protein